MRFSGSKFWLALPLLLGVALAQTPVTLTLRQITAQAGYIFAGTVTAVEHSPATQPNEVATVRITYRVDQGVRGVRTGQSLAIREWAALWNSGERYHVGERVVLVLYPPSKLGLTSPVAGPLGRFPLDSSGRLKLPPEQIQTLTSDPVVGRWLRDGSRVSGRDFVRVLRRAGKE
jgi:hypothetical protein